MFIDVKLFAHIQLDAELNNRYGVEGNAFILTLGYFNDYLNSLLNDSKKERLFEGFSLSLEQTQQTQQTQQISKDTALLLNCENEIRLLDSSMQDPQCLEQFCFKTSERIVNLNNGEHFLIPTGWNNDALNGHGMICQFEKDEKGALFFSIFNSGAGLGHHEKISFKDNERFYPIKTYSN